MALRIPAPCALPGQLCAGLRTCLSPAGALSMGIPLPKVLRIPLVNVDFQIKAVSAGMAAPSCKAPGLVTGPCQCWLCVQGL